MHAGDPLEKWKSFFKSATTIFIKSASDGIFNFSINSVKGVAPLYMSVLWRDLSVS